MSTFAQTTLVRYARWGLVAASVAVSAACGGGGGGGAPSTPANMASPASVASTGIDLVLNANRVSGVAPLAVSFNSIGTTADAALTTRPFHELSYKWEFSDTSDVPDWAYGATSSNRKKNVAYGPVAGHVFEKKGSWTVTLTATASSNKAIQVQKTVVIVVADPADLATVCVSNTVLPVPGAGGCPPNAAGQLATSWTGMATLTGVYKRILLKRGDVWSSDGHFSVGSSNSGGVIGAYGPGSTKPKIVLVSDNAAFYLNAASDWRIQDLEIVGNGVQGPTKQGVVVANSSNVLISNTSISDVFIGISSGDVVGLTIESVDVTGLYDNSQGHPGIALYLANTDNLSILGSRLRDSPTTHVARLQGTERTVVSNNLIELAGQSRNALSIRGKSTGSLFSWNGLWTQHVLVTNNEIDNSVRGGYALYVGPQSTGHAERVRDVVIDGNYIKARDLYAADFQVAERLTVRNNIMSSHYGHTVGLGLGGNAAGSPASKDLFIYNNTFYKPGVGLTTGFSAFSLSNAGQASGVSIVNNVVYGVGNNKDGTGNGSGATLMTQGGSIGSAGINFSVAGNTSNSDISAVRPWAGAAPIEAVDFSPTTSYAASYKYTSFGSIWDLSIKETPSVRVRGALEP